MVDCLKNKKKKLQCPKMTECKIPHFIQSKQNQSRPFRGCEWKGPTRSFECTEPALEFHQCLCGGKCQQCHSRCWFPAPHFPWDAPQFPFPHSSSSRVHQLPTAPTREIIQQWIFNLNQTSLISRHWKSNTHQVPSIPAERLQAWFSQGSELIFLLNECFLKTKGENVFAGKIVLWTVPNELLCHSLLPPIYLV